MAELETSAVTDVLLPLVLAVMMFGMGLSTPARMFGAVARKPRALAIGLLGQLVALPLLAMGVVILFHPTGMEQDIAIGLLLLGALPGGATSNILAHLCKGDTALSIVLTAITSLAALLWTPLVLLLSTRWLYGETVEVALSFVDVMALVLVVITIPVISGILIAKKWPAFVARVEKGFRIAGVVFLAIVVAAALLQNRDGFLEKVAMTVPAALVLNLAAMGAGYVLGRFTDGARRRSIIIEVGFQNGTFGIALATVQLGNPTMALAPAFYSLVMFATAAGLAWWWNRPGANPQSSAEPTAA